jgi:hypothetical protein
MKATSVFTAVGGALLGVILGFKLGWRQSSFQVALQENKVARANLTSTNTAPQLREYLKARVYYNVHRYFPSKSGYLLKSDWDFGPVDRNALGRLVVFKDPDWGAWDWKSAIDNK